jgi:hypothetical protein
MPAFFLAAQVGWTLGLHRLDSTPSVPNGVNDRTLYHVVSDGVERFQNWKKSTGCIRSMLTGRVTASDHSLCSTRDSAAEITIRHS